MRLFSIKGLAEHEGVTHDYLRSVLVKYRSGKLPEWRGYKFFGVGGKCWFAYPGTEAIEFFDGSHNKETPDADTPTVDAPELEASGTVPSKGKVEQAVKSRLRAGNHQESDDATE